MQFRFDPEHEEFRRTVRSLLSDVASEPRVRSDSESVIGWNTDTWERLCGEAEIAALSVPEQYGGAGYGLTELGIVLAEAGRSLLCAPLLSTSLATRALLESGDTAAAATHLPAIAAGSATATLAALEPGGNWTAAPATRAERTASGWVLSGSKDWVLDGHSAKLHIVTATTEEGTSLFLVDANSRGMQTHEVAAVDPTRKVARVTLSRTPAVPLGRQGAGAVSLRNTLDAGIALLAAEQVGLAERCLEMSTDYAKQRVQFGRPIGSFQAVKHKLATVLLEVEAAKSAMMYSLWCADHRPAELAEVACIAGPTCSSTAMLAAGENIQLHGGMGVTWEHPAHLYLKRATTSRLLFGDPQRHFEDLCHHIGLASDRDSPAA